MTSKNNKAPLLYNIKLCASFQTHWWIQTAVTVQKCSIRVKIDDFLSCVTWKFDGWHWQTIGHLFCATSSFVNHFIEAIGEFKLEWQSGKLNSAQNQRYLSLVTLKLHGWPWKTIGHIFYATSRLEHHCIAICEFKLGIQSEKYQFWVKINFFFALWPWNLMNNLEIGHLFYAMSIFMYHFIAICDIKLEIQSGNDQFGLKSTIFFSHVTLKFDRWPWKSIGHHS